MGVYSFLIFYVPILLYWNTPTTSFCQKSKFIYLFILVFDWQASLKSLDEAVSCIDDQHGSLLASVSGYLDYTIVSVCLGFHLFIFLH